MQRSARFCVRVDLQSLQNNARGQRCMRDPGAHHWHHSKSMCWFMLRGVPSLPFFYWNLSCWGTVSRIFNRVSGICAGAFRSRRRGGYMLRRSVRVRHPFQQVLRQTCKHTLDCFFPPSSDDHPHRCIVSTRFVRLCGNCCCFSGAAPHPSCRTEGKPVQTFQDVCAVSPLLQPRSCNVSKDTSDWGFPF